MEIQYRHECESLCDVEWCSLACFMRRGYIRQNGKFLRNENNEFLRLKENRQCNWEVKNHD